MLIHNYQLAASGLREKYRKQCLSKFLAKPTFGFNLRPELLPNVKNPLLLKSSLRSGVFSLMLVPTYG